MTDKCGNEAKLEGAKRVIELSCLRSGVVVRCAVLLIMTCCASGLFAESCATASEMEPAVKAALTSAGQRYFDLLSKGDAASLRQSAIPSLAADFSAIEGTVKDNQAALAGSKATARLPFLLTAEGTAPLARAEFFCGVFGANGQTKDSAVFTLGNLPPGKYAVVILDAAASKGAYTVSLILQQIGTDWKVGGLYIKAAQFSGHDGDWFISQAKQYQSKNQLHNAALYYLEARSLVSPLPFMSTAASDKLWDESSKAQPADFPTDDKTVDLASGGTTYKVSAIFPEVVGNDLDLIVKYKAADVSNTGAAYQSNVAVMKALLAKYPEFKDAFTGMVARASDPSGRDYGTLLAMKDIK